MKRLMRNTPIILSLAGTLALTACSGSNPLETQSPEAVNEFLKEASAYAELKVNYNLHNSQGVMYHACMVGLPLPVKGHPHFCTRLYQDMVAYAHSTDGPFQSLTVKQLTDKEVFTQRDAQHNHDFFAMDAQ